MLFKRKTTSDLLYLENGQGGKRGGAKMLKQISSQEKLGDTSTNFEETNFESGVQY
jgi:hypothetical protein